jgi:hypothetical protein
MRSRDQLRLTERVTVRLSRNDIERLRTTSTHRDESISEIIRKSINQKDIGEKVEL